MSRTKEETHVVVLWAAGTRVVHAAAATHTERTDQETMDANAFL